LRLLRYLLVFSCPKEVTILLPHATHKKYSISFLLGD
jgi:hypothetical protein